MRSILKNKKAFLTRDLLVAAALFSTVFALYGLMIVGVAAEYGDETIVNEAIIENYDRLGESTETLTLALDTVRSGEGLGFRGAFDVAFAGTFTVFQLVLSTIDLFGSVMASFAPDFGLDDRVVGLVYTLLFLIIIIGAIFVWISSISRGKL